MLRASESALGLTLLVLLLLLDVSEPLCRRVTAMIGLRCAGPLLSSVYGECGPLHQRIWAKWGRAFSEREKSECRRIS